MRFYRPRPGPTGAGADGIAGGVAVKSDRPIAIGSDQGKEKPMAQEKSSSESAAGGAGRAHPAEATTPPAPPAGPPPWWTEGRSSRGGGVVRRGLTGLVVGLLVISLLANLYLGFLVWRMIGGLQEEVYQAGDEAKRVVVLPIKGMIDEQSAGFVRRALDSLRNDPPEAVILRVSSGGGGVSAADRIWHYLHAFRESSEIPIVASFGTVAASGGYYVAAPADRIVAERTAITGSIGVIAQALTVKGLLDKLGIEPEVITSTESPEKDELNPMRSWTEEDREKLRGVLDHAYERFVEVVVQGREQKMSEKEVRAAATGEIFTAEAAKERDLVDEIGYLADAIEAAKKLAGLEEDATPQVTVLRPPRDLGWLGLLLGRARTTRADTRGGWREWLEGLDTPRIQYRWAPGPAARIAEVPEG